MKAAVVSKDKAISRGRTSNQQYDYTALISAYIDVQRGNFVHQNFEKFYRSRLTALETAFAVRLSSVNVPRYRAVWMLFEATASSYIATHHPRHGFLDDSLITRQLKEMGESGEEVFRIECELGETIEKAHSLQFQLLTRLFVIMYSDHPEVFTSEDLKSFGFDDSIEPQLWDYDEYR